MSQDQLLNEIKTLLEECGQYHQEGRHRQSLRCYQKAMILAAPLEDLALKAFLLASIGAEHRDCDEYHHAVELLVTALSIVPMVDETLPLQATIKKRLAITFKDVFGPQHPDVMRLLEESREDYRKSGDSGQEANVLQHIGGSLIQLGRLGEADATLTEALELSRKAGDQQLEGWIYDDLAELEIERNDWGMALEYTRTGRAKVVAVRDQEGEADTLITEARVLLRMLHIEDALDHATQALEMYYEAKNRRRAIRARRHIAKALVELERVDEAITELGKALRTAETLELIRDQVTVMRDLAALECKRRNFGRASELAISARYIADQENMDDIVHEIDQLLKRCL